MDDLGLGFSFDADQIRELVRWVVLQERADPPPHFVKGASVLSGLQRLGYRTLVETGTHLGAMPDLASRFGYQVITIELSRPLFERAQARFADNPRVTCVYGDSSEMLPKVIAGLEEPALFWIDSHFCGGASAMTDGRISPILSEIAALKAIRAERPEIIDQSSFYIDDIRLSGTEGYPRLSAIVAAVEDALPNHSCSIANDALRLIPEQRRKV